MLLEAKTLLNRVLYVTKRGISSKNEGIITLAALYTLSRQA